MVEHKRRDNRPLTEFTGYLRPRRRYYQYLAFALLLALIFMVILALIQHNPTRELTSTTINSTPMVSPSAIASASLPIMLPALPSETEPSVTASPSDATSMLAAGDLAGLIIPVAGVRPSELHDTFNEARAA